MNNELIFNRVKGLKFLYDNFPQLYNKDRIEFYFCNSKDELKNLNINSFNFDTLLLKRSSNKSFISDIRFKDNRFFNTLEELKQGIEEFDDIFDFCVECHKFKDNENYYSDRLAIAQFSTKKITPTCDKINFIPAKVDGVNTRDNHHYLEVEFPYNTSNIFNITSKDQDMIIKNNLNNFSISYLITQIHSIIEVIKNYINELNYENDFQLIIRIDSYLNLLPIDLRTADAWTKINKWDKKWY